MAEEDPRSRLVLGTVQLGLPYGIANRTGQPDQAEADAILKTAWAGGVRILDTAQAYGNSESVIGRFLQTHPDAPFDVVTKIAADVDDADPAAIETAVRESRQRLGRAPTAFMLHRGDQLKAWDGPLGTTLLRLKKAGEIGALGVSLYEPDEFAAALAIPAIDWIQAPFNALDRRLLDSGLLAEAAQKGKTVFLRSAFLQGLLLADPASPPAGMGFAGPALAEWGAVLNQAGLSPLEGALGFVAAAAPDAKIVVGCESAEQLRGILVALEREPLPPDALARFLALPPGDARLIHPGLWPQRETP